MSDIGLGGRVALVTGSSRGIGLAIAERLAEEGVRVVMNGRASATLRDAAEGLRVRGHAVDEVVADVGRPADVERLFRHLAAAHGPLDILVNNAGLANPVAHLLDLDLELWSEVIRSNLTSVFLCTRLAANQMVRAHTQGAVINISSFGAFRAHRSLAAYDTAKGGMEAFTRAAALDLAPFGIRVNAVAPGPIKTESTGASEQDVARRAALVPLGRIGLPSDVADAVVFLASGQARFITGQTIVVDGGALSQILAASLDTPGLNQDDVEARPPLLQRGPGSLRDDTDPSISAMAVAVPLQTPVRWATREVPAREYVIVRIAGRSGSEGVGYAYAGMHTARALATYVEDVLAPRLIGLPDTAPTRPWADLYQESVLVGRRGFVLRAISAIDIALWDLLGRIVDQPVSRLLGGISDRVPAYASGGYYRPGDPIANVDREISRYLELGFRDVKIKVGGLPPDADAARVERVRSLIGPSGRVALDANNAWSYPFEAIRFARMVEAFDPWWLEEPLAVDDIAGHAEVARVLDMPVATGRIDSSRADFRDLIGLRAADILQPDAAVIGGISEWTKVAHAAATFGFPVAPHWNQDVHVHLAASVANCIAVEWFDAQQDIVNFDRLLTEPLLPEDGLLTVPDRPGLGMRFDWDAVERYRVPLGAAP